MDPTRIVVVAHDASRTGAPIVLATLLRWVRAEHGIDPPVVLARGGPLVEVLGGDHPATVVGGPLVDASTQLVAGLDSMGAVRLRRAAHMGRGVVRRRAAGGARRAVRVLGDADLVVVNSLAALELAADLAPRTARMVCLVHELDHVADRVLPADPRARAGLVDRVEHFAAVGPAVERMLVQRWGVPARRVVTVDPCIEAPPPADPGGVAAVRSLVGVPEGGALVLAVGSATRRKAPERFIDLMAMLVDHPAAPVGAWLGAEPASVVAAEMLADIERAGIGERVHVVSPAADPADWLHAADVVVSTAREDPFPLALLEAAAAGVPIVSFDSGGAGELLARGGAADDVVPTGDLVAMRARVAEVLDDPPVALLAAAKLQAHVRSAYRPDVAADRMWSAVRDPADRERAR